MSDPISRLNAALDSRYRIERQLGEGGMATVYLADDLRHERKVALKVLKSELAAVLGAERFLGEIKTTANLQHPHILPLFDSGEADGFLFYVMPYVEGESLQDRLRREGQLPVDEAVTIASNVAEALDYAHARGVIHRDIKPANILLHAGKPLVADFGIALAARSAGGQRLTETGLSLGTPYYMSPEQATGDQVVGPASDIYALGCVLYEMLAGEPPHAGSSAQAVLAKILTGEVPSLSARRKTVPPNVDAAVRRTLERLAADRFASAGDFRRALMDAGFRYGGSGGAGAGAGAGSSTRWRAVAVAAVVVAIASTALAVRGGLRSGGGAAQSPGPTRVTLVDERPGGPQPLAQPVAISRDGRRVAFLGAMDGRVGLYVRSLDGPEVRLLSGNAPLGGTDVLSVGFSPDGRSVAFAGTDGLARRVSVDGGVPQVVAHTGTVPIGLTWSGTYGIVMGMFAFSSEPGLSRVELQDTTVRRLPPPGAADYMQHDPLALPDDEFAIYTHFPETGPPGLGVVGLSDGGVSLHDLDPPPDDGNAWVGVAGDVLLYWDWTRTLTAVRWDEERRAPVGRPVAVPNVPAGAAFAALSEGGTLAMEVGSAYARVSIVNDRGDETTSITDFPFAWAVARFSPDGSRLALAGQIEQNAAAAARQRVSGPILLGTYDSPAGPLAQMPAGIPLRMAAWSAAGSRLLTPIGFDRERRRRDAQIWSRAADGSDQPTVEMNTGAQVWAVEPSPDERRLALVVSTSTDPTTPAYDIVIRATEGDTTLIPFAATPANEVAPRFSPDGRWLAYASDETGRYEVYVRPQSGAGGRVQVSDAGGGQPVWSADGRRLFYVTDSGLVAARVDGAGGGDRLRVTSRDRLFEADILGGAGAYTSTYDAHPDGERLVIARNVGGGNEIVLWMDWLDEVKALLEE